MFKIPNFKQIRGETFSFSLLQNTRYDPIMQNTIQQSKIPYLAVAPVAMGGSTIVENPLQIGLVLQNKANFTKCPNGHKSINKKHLWSFITV